MSKVKILAIVGKSASGKTTLQEKINEFYAGKVNRVVTTTTRPRRQGEVHGKDYYFVSVEEFTEKILSFEMLEAKDFNDWFYGTEIGALDKNKINIGVYTPSGVLDLAENPEVDLRVLYVIAKDKTRLLRSLNREDNPDCDEIMRRYEADKKDFDDETIKEMQDNVKYKIINGESSQLDLWVFAHSNFILGNDD